MRCCREESIIAPYIQRGRSGHFPRDGLQTCLKGPARWRIADRRGFGAVTEVRNRRVRKEQNRIARAPGRPLERHEMTNRLTRSALVTTGLFCLLLAARPHLGANAVVAATTSPAPFTLCKSTYALCTTARCTPTAGHAGSISCGCSVHTGYSAATTACRAVQQTNAGRSIVSRYYPVKAYAICANGRPWANCLDSPCLIDKRDPSKATCTCTIAKNQHPYVIVTNKYSKSMCATGIISSATVQASERISNFIQEQRLMPPFTIKVLNSPSP